MSVDKTNTSFSYLTIGTLAANGLQAVFYMIFATLLKPEMYGQMSYFIALAGIFSIISLFGLHQTVTVYQAKKKSVIANQANVLAVITTAVAALILIPINVYAALLAFGFSSFAINQYNLLGLKKYKQFAWTAIVKSILLLIIPIALYFIFEVPGIFVGMAISNFFGSFDFFKSLNMKVQSFHELRDNYKVVIHNFGVDMSQNLPPIVDKLLIVPLFGLFVVGIYQFNIQILLGLGTLPRVLHIFLLPEESGGTSHKKISYLAIFGSGLLALAVIVFSPIIINNFFPKFSEGIFSLQIMGTSLIPLSVSSIYNAKLQAIESTKIGLSGIVRIVSLLGLIAMLGNLYGLVGLSIAVLLSTILYTISLAILYHRVTHKIV